MSLGRLPCLLHPRTIRKEEGTCPECCGLSRTSPIQGLGELRRNHKCADSGSQRHCHTISFSNRLLV